MKKTGLTIGLFMIVLTLIITTFNITYCFVEYGKNVEIEFETNGGNEIESLNYIYEYGNILTKMPTPQKEGYSFKGWYLDKNYKNKLLEMPIPQFETNEVTLYAKWEEKNNVTYKSSLMISGVIVLSLLTITFVSKKSDIKK